MEETNLLEKSKPSSLKLADSKDYQLPPMPLSLTTLANIEKTMGMGGAKLAQKMIDEPNTTLRLTLYALLKEKNPELTLEKAGELVTLDNVKEVSKVISQIYAMT